MALQKIAPNRISSFIWPAQVRHRPWLPSLGQATKVIGKFNAIRCSENHFFFKSTSILRYNDVWLQQDKDNHDRRRSSTLTHRYSLFDALDLECALLRAATRGSVGPYSLSESLHKLTFTQSLAFPALARGLATKQRRTGQEGSNQPSQPHESLLNTFAKVITAVVLFVVSILVFLIVYKFVKTWGLLLTQNSGLTSPNGNASNGHFSFHPPNDSTSADFASYKRYAFENKIEAMNRSRKYDGNWDAHRISHGNNSRHSTYGKMKAPLNGSN